MNLDSYINDRFGDKIELARVLGVSPATVRHWTRQNPRGILRYAPELADKGIEPLTLVKKVMAHEDWLKS